MKNSIFSNDEKVIGVIGNGYVGGAIANCIPPGQARIFDVDPNRSTHSMEEVVSDSDAIFVCVPTPTIDGACNLSYIDAVLANIVSICCKETEEVPLIILKSTVPPGTTLRFSKQFNIDIAFVPEFLTAATANDDFKNTTDIPVGYDHTIVGAALLKAYQALGFDGEYISFYKMTSSSAEMLKYMFNCFFATKNIFMNQMRDIFNAKEVGTEADWLALVAFMKTDRRIGIAHMDIPGHDGKPGFGGACLPKDLDAFVTWTKKSEHKILLYAIAELNKQKYGRSY